MNKRPLALLLALLTLAGPATFVAARPGGNRGGGDRGGPTKGAVNGVVASVDATTSSFVLHLEGKRGRRRSQTQDVTIRTNAKTVFTLGDRSQGSFADVADGARAVVKGTRNTDGSLLAQYVALKAARPPKEASVKGIVDYIDSDTISFLLTARARGRDGVSHDILVHTNADTVFKNEDGSEASFADLAVGDAVDARGTFSADGFQATSVRIHGEDEPQPVKLRGAVDSVDAETSSISLRLGGGRTGDVQEAPSVLIHTDADTIFTKPDGSLGSFADVVVGVSAAVAATRHGDGFLARSVQLIAPEPPHEVAVRGAVVSIDAASPSFVLKPGDPREAGPVEHPSISVHTGGDTVFVKPDGSAASFADITVGARVAVKGTANSDHSVNAKVVAIAGEEPPHEVALRGVVASVDASTSSFVLKPGDGHDGASEDHPGVTVHTGNATLFQHPDGTAATFAEVVVGAPVAVKGTANEDRSVKAKLVLIGAEEPPHEVGIAGIVVKVDAESHRFVVQRPERDHSHSDPGEIVVQTDEKTVFTKGDAKAGFGDVVADAVVKCLGTFSADGNFQAARVAIFIHER